MADDPTKQPESEEIEPSAAAPDEAAATPETPSAEAPEAAPAPAASGNVIGQDELDQLKAQFEALQREQGGASGSGSTAKAARPAPVAPAPPPPPPPAPAEPELSDDALMAEMAAALASEAAATAPSAAAATPPATAAATSDAEPLAGATAYRPDELATPGGPLSAATIDLLDDVELEVRVELGRTEMYIEDVLKLGNGAVIELDKLAGDPVDVYVNKRLVARGEVLVLNDNFCVRINSIHSPIPELETA